MFHLALLALFAGCVVTLPGASGSSSPAAESAPSASAQPTASPPTAAPKRITRADVIAWARRARDAGIDCPMAPDEAERLQTQSAGPSDAITAAIGCMCSVELTCGGYRRQSCPQFGPSKRLAVYDPEAPARDPEGDQLLAAWEDRLYARRAVPLAKITRATPLPPPDRAAYLATVDRPGYLAQIEHDRAQMEDVIAKQMWGSLEDFQSHAHVILAELERRSCGAHSDEGRALVAKIDAEFAAHKQDIARSAAVDARITSDPAFARLTAERDRLEKQLAEFEHAHGSAADVCTSSARAGWQICRVAARLDQVNEQMNDRIAAISGRR